MLGKGQFWWKEMCKAILHLQIQSELGLGVNAGVTAYRKRPTPLLRIESIIRLYELGKRHCTREYISISNQDPAWAPNHISIIDQEWLTIKLSAPQITTVMQQFSIIRIGKKSQVRQRFVFSDSGENDWKLAIGYRRFIMRVVMMASVLTENMKNRYIHRKRRKGSGFSPILPLLRWRAWR